MVCAGGSHGRLALFRVPIDPEACRKLNLCRLRRLLYMNPNRERLEVRVKLERYRELLREFPDGPTGEMLQEYIADLEQQLRDLGEDR